jgi:hypothetical protein
MTAEEKLPENLDKKNLKWVRIGVIINFLMFLFFIPSIFNIHFSLPNFDKQEHQIYNVEPVMYPSNLLILNTSPAYYAEIKFNNVGDLKYGSSLSFSLTATNKGKNIIEKPEYIIFICDPLGRIRGTYPKIDKTPNKSEDLFTVNDGTFFELDGSQLNFIFNFPPLDQKVLGYWRIYAYLINKSSNSLVSYAVQDFKVNEDISSATSAENPFITIFTSITASVIGGIIIYYIGYNRKKKW